MLLFILAATAAATAAAPDHTRYRFAEMWVGGDLTLNVPTGQHMLPALGGPDLSPAFFSSAHTDAGGIPPTLGPRVGIGALHFWGHADLYILIPTVDVRLGALPEGVSGGGLRPGVETGAKVYPLAVEDGVVRPYVGIAWQPLSFSQATTADGAGPTVSIHRARALLGGAYRTDNHVVELGLGWVPQVTMDYATSPTHVAAMDQQLWSVHVGYKFLFDTTASLEADDAEGRTQQRLDRLTERKARSGVELAAGPSSAFTLGPTSFQDGDPQAFLGNRPNGTLMPDVAVGGYFHRPELVLRLSWRPISQRTVGYGAERQWSRQSASIDVFRFLTDVHGFVPFVGLGGGVESLRFEESVEGRTVRGHTQQGLAASLVVGWDIRPSEAQSWLLRTNLRYTPGLAIDLESVGDHVDFQHLVVNFIQFVWYPQRTAAFARD